MPSLIRNHIPRTLLYIPLCFYFNNVSYRRFPWTGRLYIPLCFYFNHIGHLISFRILQSLHSTMFLFQWKLVDGGFDILFSFTFHYVSISMQGALRNSVIYPNFTFHYVSISMGHDVRELTEHITLHSTMFLFQFRSPVWLAVFFSALHSTMFLFQSFSRNFLTISITLYIPLCFYFNSARQRLYLDYRRYFTFHYVSISIQRSIQWLP